MCGQPDDDRPQPARRRLHVPKGHDSRIKRPEKARPLQNGPKSHIGWQTQPREAPSLADLGFETRLEQQVPYGEAGTHSLYTIKERGKLSHIARLSLLDNGAAPTPAAAAADATTLFVHYLATDADSRAGAARPRARDVLASFWVDAGGRSLRRLRRLYFETVVERSTRDVVRDWVCPLLGVPYDVHTDGPRGDVTLWLPRARLGGRGVGEEEEEAQDLRSAAEAWGHLCRGSRLVRSAMGMPRRFPMEAPGEENLEVVRIDISEGVDPFGNHSAFDLEVTFGHREFGISC